MAKKASSNFDSSSILAPLLLILYLCIGFIPNWQAVDKIAPQWLVMSILNLLSLIYFFSKKTYFTRILTINLMSSLTLTYIGFILWAIGSLAYAINPTEVTVNLARQLNVFLMFFSMVILTYRLKKKLHFLPWVITLILAIEVYYVLSEALEMVNSSGRINGSNLKGITANRNITAFSIAIKIPFVLILIHFIKKAWIKVFGFFLVTLSFSCSKALS